MSWYTIQETSSGRLQLSPDTRRQFDSEKFTWGHLLYGKLAPVKAYVIYFPSRFDLKIDTTAEEALRVFGGHTGSGTSVNFWDPQDPKFSDALQLFDLKSTPALVFATGLQLNDIEPYGPNKANLYTIAITDPEVLGDRERLASVANSVHEIIIRSNPKEIAGYLRKSTITSLLAALAKVAGGLLDQLLKLKPKFQLPGGASLELGG
jgi:hypothetical protein